MNVLYGIENVLRASFQSATMHLTLAKFEFIISQQNAKYYEDIEDSHLEPRHHRN